MAADPTPDLTPTDREAANDELARLAGRAAPRDPQIPGCLVSFAGMVVLTLTPALGNWVELSPEAGMALFAFAVAALFAGAVVALLGGTLQSRAVRRDAEAAVHSILAYLEGGSDREEAVRAAARLVALAAGPGSRNRPPFRVDEVSRRLGPAGLALVGAVERHRTASGSGMPPIFPGGPEGTGG